MPHRHVAGCIVGRNVASSRVSTVRKRTDRREAILVRCGFGGAAVMNHLKNGSAPKFGCAKWRNTKTYRRAIQMLQMQHLKNGQLAGAVDGKPSPEKRIGSSQVE
jgi:hypothetical protein